MLNVSAALQTPLSFFKTPVCKNPPSHHFVAHLFPGNYLQGSVLEGSFYDRLLDTLISYLKDFTETKSAVGELSLQIIPHFKELESQAKTIARLQRSKDPKQLADASKDLHTKIHSIPKGSSYLMLGGWTGSHPEKGHAMLYEFTKTKEGLWSLCLIQTETKATQLVTTPLLIFSKIDPNKLSPLFFQALLEPRVLPLWNPTKSTNWMAHITTTLHQTTPHKDVLSSIHIPAQQADTCAMDSLLAYIRYKGGDVLGKQLQDRLQVTTLSRVWKVLRPSLNAKAWQDPEMRQAISLAEAAAQILLKTHANCPAKESDSLCLQANALSSEMLVKIGQVRASGIFPVQGPQIYTPQLFPLVHFHRSKDNTEQLWTENPEYALAKHHTHHLLHSYSHYVVVEHRKTKEKLLLLPLLAVTKEEPLSSVVTPIATKASCCSLCCISGVWQGTDDLTNFYLAYLFLSMREYAKAVDYLQKIKTPLQNVYAKTIFQWMRAVNDQSDEKQALINYAQKLF